MAKVNIPDIFLICIYLQASDRVLILTYAYVNGIAQYTARYYYGDLTLQKTLPIQIENNLKMQFTTADSIVGRVSYNSTCELLLCYDLETLQVRWSITFSSSIVRVER